VGHERITGGAALLVVTTGVVVGLAAAQTQPGGGIVPTEFHTVKVAPGPEPDVTFFATGDALGKVEPCG
jgi:hypothetical protein